VTAINTTSSDNGSIGNGLAIFNTATAVSVPAPDKLPEQQQQQQQLRVSQGAQDTPAVEAVPADGEPEAEAEADVTVNDQENAVSSAELQQLKIPDGAQEALQFVHGRRKLYEEKGLSRRWKMRGIGYLYSHRNMVLKAANVPAEPVQGRNVIVIENVHQNAALVRDDCSLLTIWVRVDGPEIFAGMAKAVQPDGANSSCYWEFSYDLQQPGDYRVDAKVLVWNGLAQVDGDESQCEVHTGNATQALDKFPIHAGFVGFKLYSPTQSCCEICTRLAPYCQYWSTPALGIEKPSRYTNGCELFFKEGTPEDFIPLSHLTRRRRLNKRGHRRLAVDTSHGPPHSNPTSYFVGCGWSNWFTLDFPCESGDLDDRIHLAQSTFSFTPQSSTVAGESLDSPLPLCTVENESLERSNGRWARESWPGPDECPSNMEVDRDFKKRFDIMKNDGAHPHCWHRDDLSQVGKKCIEMNCRLVAKKSNWISPLHEEKDWFGVWRPYDCDYLEFTDAQLQQCVSKRKISLMKTEGASIAAYMRDYLELRLKNITMYDASDPDAINVTIDTLKLLHLNGPVSTLESRLNKMPVVGKNEEYYWVTGFFLTSERETHVQVSRMDLFNHHVPKIMDPKGYKMINAFDMSAGFAYEAATQFDGMHFIGPPMKMMLTKVFHHMCADTVEGSRL
jgi:hypothetical protein